MFKKKFSKLKEYFSNNTLVNKIRYFLHFKMPFTKAWNDYYNPYFIWWKSRKYFKRPKWKMAICGKTSWFFGLPISNKCYNRIFDIRISALGWKSKYNSPRHEWNPYVAITVFRKWQIVWVLVYGRKDDKYKSTRNMATWEAMLDYLYFNIPIEEVADHHVWSSGFGENAETITITENMK